jgi:hypothetical protein
MDSTGAFWVNATTSLLIVKSSSSLLAVGGFTTVAIPPFSARWVQPYGKTPLADIRTLRCDFISHASLHGRQPASENQAAASLESQSTTATLSPPAPAAAEGVSEGSPGGAPSPTKGVPDTAAASVRARESDSPSQAAATSSPSSQKPAAPVQRLAVFSGITVRCTDRPTWHIVLESTNPGSGTASLPYFSLHTIVPPVSEVSEPTPSSPPSGSPPLATASAQPERRTLRLPPVEVIAAALQAEGQLRVLQSLNLNAFQALGVTSDESRLRDDSVPAAAQVSIAQLRY